MDWQTFSTIEEGWQIFRIKISRRIPVSKERKFSTWEMCQRRMDRNRFKEAPRWIYLGIYMNIVACGVTGSTWNGEGGSIGVNDCEKFGKKVAALVCVNSNFELDREQIIKNTVAPAGFYSQLTYWANQPNYKPMPPMKEFHGRENTLEKGWIYSSRSSPFIAISLAVYLGHNEITLYGCDFEKHPILNEDRLEREVDAYKRYIEWLHIKGVIVFLSTDYGALRKFVPVKK